MADQAIDYTKDLEKYGARIVSAPKPTAAPVSGPPPLPKGLDAPRWKPGDELPENAPGDIEIGGAAWDTPEENKLAEDYNRQLDAWKASQKKPSTAAVPPVDAQLETFVHKYGGKTTPTTAPRTPAPAPEATDYLKDLEKYGARIVTPSAAKQPVDYTKDLEKYGARIVLPPPAGIEKTGLPGPAQPPSIGISGNEIQYGPPAELTQKRRYIIRPAPVPGIVPGTEETGLPKPGVLRGFVPAHRNVIVTPGQGTYSPEYQTKVESIMRPIQQEPGEGAPYSLKAPAALYGMAQGMAEASPPPPGKPIDADKQIAGLDKMLRSAFTLIEPLAGIGAVESPVYTYLTYLAANYGGKKVASEAQKLGASPEKAQAAGDAVSAIIGGIGGQRVARGIWKAAGKPEVTVQFEEPIGGVRVTPEGGPDLGPRPPKPFSEMTSTELLKYRNLIETDRPSNYEVQRNQIAQEVMKRGVERGMPAPEPQQPPEAEVLPRDRVQEALDAQIAEQQAAEVARRRAEGRLPEEAPPEPQPPPQ